MRPSKKLPRELWILRPLWSRGLGGERDEAAEPMGSGNMSGC
jgi:hypothetical protein